MEKTNEAGLAYVYSFITRKTTIFVQLYTPLFTFFFLYYTVPVVPQLVTHRIY